MMTSTVWEEFVLPSNCSRKGSMRFRRSSGSSRSRNLFSNGSGKPRWTASSRFMPGCASGFRGLSGARSPASCVAMMVVASKRPGCWSRRYESAQPLSICSTHRFGFSIAVCRRNRTKFSCRCGLFPERPCLGFVVRSCSMPERTEEIDDGPGCHLFSPASLASTDPDLPLAGTVTGNFLCY